MDQHSQEVLYNLLSESQLTESNFRAAQSQLRAGLDSTRDGLAMVQDAVAATTVTLEHHTAQLEQILQSAQMRDAVRESDARDGRPGQGLANLQRMNETLTEENQKLQTDRQDLKKKLRASRDYLIDSDREHKAQLERARSPFLNNASSTNEVDDSQVQSATLWLQAKIHTISTRFCVGKGKQVHREIGEFTTLDAEWTRKAQEIVSKGYSQTDVELCRVYWVRSKIAMFLEREVFNARVFGLEGHVEDGLADFEKLIAWHNPDLDTSDWRALTLRYSKPMKITHTDLPSRTAMLICNLFQPWVHGNINPELVRLLKELCQHTYDLCVVLRRSIDKYVLVPVAEGTRYEGPREGEEFEPEYILRSRETRRRHESKVWASIFGALVKETQAGERTVLLKAKVMCMV